MKKLFILCAMATLGLTIGCGPQAAPPATEAEVEAVQAPVDDYMKQMEQMGSSTMKEAPDMGVKASGGAPEKTE